jgi:hypothetical protein
MRTVGSATLGDERAIDRPHHGVNFARGRCGITPKCAARPVQIARPSRRVHQRKRGLPDCWHGVRQALCNFSYGRRAKLLQRYPRKAELALCPIDGCHVEEILADVDSDDRRARRRRAGRSYAGR